MVIRLRQRSSEASGFYEVVTPYPPRNIERHRIRALAQELVGLQPDIILTHGTPATVALQRETRTIPIAFATGSGPVASGHCRATRAKASPRVPELLDARKRRLLAP